MHLRQSLSGEDQFSDSVTQFHSSDDGAPTTLLHKDDNDDDNHIQISHHATGEPTATDFTYRDREGRLHEVKVIDRPTEEVGDGERREKEEEEEEG